LPRGGRRSRRSRRARDGAGVEPAGGWVGRPEIHASKGHNLVFTASEIPAEALFLDTLSLPGQHEGMPLVGPVPGPENVIVATDQGNAPATGEVVAEPILDGAARIDISPFDPARLPPTRRRQPHSGSAAVSRTRGRHGVTRERQ
jgi:hypothetical protein